MPETQRDIFGLIFEIIRCVVVLFFIMLNFIFSYWIDFFNFYIIFYQDLFNQTWLSSGSAVLPKMPLIDSIRNYQSSYLSSLPCSERDLECLRKLVIIINFLYIIKLV